MKIDKLYMERAMELHRIHPVVDAHLDLAGELYFRVKRGEKNPLRDCYLQNLRTGRFNLIVSSVYLKNDQLPEGGLRLALDQISVLLEAIDLNPEFCLIRTKKDLEAAINADRIGILLYMEGLDCIGNDLKLLRVLWELGVRGASLTWSRRNMLATGCCTAVCERQIFGGLSEEGILAVKEMERLGMFLDISHLNDDGFEDICKVTKKSFVATHSNSRSVHFNYRNLTDEQMQRLSSQGGMMGLNGCIYIAGCANGEDPLEMLCRHIEYAVNMLGADKVGYGFDFCDSYTEAEPRQQFSESHDDALVDHSHVPELTAVLLQRGMKEVDVVKIIGGNWVGYFRKMLPEI